MRAFGNPLIVCTYHRLGHYEDCIKSNVAAIAADEKFVVHNGIFNYYTAYRIHNMHFVSYAAMFAGEL
jgi:hypothetical protein